MRRATFSEEKALECKIAEMRMFSVCMLDISRIISWNESRKTGIDLQREPARQTE